MHTARLHLTNTCIITVGVYYRNILGRNQTQKLFMHLKNILSNDKALCTYNHVQK